MSQPADPLSHPAPLTEGLERLDIDAAASAARHRRHPVVRALGAASEIADQIPLALVCGTILAGGLVGGRPQVAWIGARMLAAHVLANVVKRRIKNRLRRTRPEKALEEQDYAFEPGRSRDGHETSFPSGHTAGAVAVAAIVARDQPLLAAPAIATAILMSAIQVPRARHYPSDVAAGAALGLAAAGLVNLLLPPLPESHPQENDHVG